MRNEGGSHRKQILLPSNSRQSRSGAHRKGTLSFLPLPAHAYLPLKAILHATEFGTVWILKFNLFCHRQVCKWLVQILHLFRHLFKSFSHRDISVQKEIFLYRKRCLYVYIDRYRDTLCLCVYIYIHLIIYTYAYAYIECPLYICRCWPGPLLPFTAYWPCPGHWVSFSRQVSGLDLLVFKGPSSFILLCPSVIHL